MFMFFYREAMTPSSLAESAEEDVCVSLCGSVANYCFFSICIESVVGKSLCFFIAKR